MPQYSIIIPVYNRASLTSQCLNALLAAGSESVDFEIIVVDDASTDLTQRLLTGYGDQIRVVTHTANTGFATSCNDAAAVASGEYFVFLNNDTIPQAGWLDALVRYADRHPNAAVVGSKLLFPNDTIQHAGVVICQDRNPRHLYAGFPAHHAAVNTSRRFQVVTAACALVRREPFELVEGFDSTFRNGYEDVDLCLRLGEHGYEVHYCHESVLYHLERVSREGNANEDRRNLRLYRSRWAQRVQPDDVHYYLEDGLLRLHHRTLYPITFSISPLLALVGGDEYERQVEQVLNMRSRQVSDLLRETIRLTMHAQEAELRQAIDVQVDDQLRPPYLDKEREAAQREMTEGRQEVEKDAAAYRNLVAAQSQTMSSREAELQAMLADAHDQLLRRDEEILSAIYSFQASLAALQHDLPPATTTAGETFEPSKYIGYRQLTRRIRELVRSALPPDAVVIVVSAGDDELLNLDSRRGWHFPQLEDGACAGAHPANSDEAIVHLEGLRARGGDFLLFPSTAFWWLEYYVEFKQHLESHYQVVVRHPETCLIFALRESATEPEHESLDLHTARQQP